VCVWDPEGTEPALSINLALVLDITSPTPMRNWKLDLSLDVKLQLPMVFGVKTRTPGAIASSGVGSAGGGSCFGCVIRSAVCIAQGARVFLPSRGLAGRSPPQTEEGCPTGHRKSSPKWRCSDATLAGCGTGALPIAFIPLGGPGMSY